MTPTTKQAAQADNPRGANTTRGRQAARRQTAPEPRPDAGQQAGQTADAQPDQTGRPADPAPGRTPGQDPRTAAPGELVKLTKQLGKRKVMDPKTSTLLTPPDRRTPKKRSKTSRTE